MQRRDQVADAKHASYNLISGTSPKEDIPELPHLSKAKHELSDATPAHRGDLHTKTNAACAKPNAPKTWNYYLSVFYQKPRVSPSFFKKPRSLLVKTVKATILTYVAICMVYLSFVLAKQASAYIASRFDTVREERNVELHEDFSALPLVYQLSKISPHLPKGSSETFRPYFISSLQGPPPSDALTACIWINDIDVDKLLAWVNQWNGPVSILLTTPYDSGTLSYDTLENTLSELAMQTSGSASLAIHVITIPVTPLLQVHNAFINLARIYAPTNYTVLFPSSVHVLPHPMHLFQNSIHPELPYPAIIIPPTTNISYDVSEGPPPPGSSIIISKFSSVWCIERFFTPSHYEFDECIWQFWLRYGYASSSIDAEADPKDKEVHFEVTGFGWASSDLEFLTYNSTATDTILHNRMYQRYAPRFRNEACLLAARELLALGLWSHPAPGSDQSNPRTRWIKKQCQEFLTAWEGSLLTEHV